MVYLWLILLTGSGWVVEYQSEHVGHDACREAGELYVQRNPGVVRGYICKDGHVEANHQ